jgi:Tfp pilus assembly protein PilF
MRYGAALSGLAMVSAVVLSLYPADDRAERLARHLNLGKAFYENPATPKEAVEEFRQALALNPRSAREHLNYGLALLRAGSTKEGVAELEKARSIDPKLPHPYFNLGVVFKKEGDFDRALREFEQMAKLVPDEPVTHYNLGVLYKLQGKLDRALAEFETARKLDPTLAAPHFQLFNAYRTSQRAAEAQRELAIFQEIKKRQTALGTSEDMDWCYYAEILETIPPAGPAAAPPVEVAFEEQRLGTLEGPALGITALDAGGDGRPEVLAWSAGSVVLFGRTPVTIPGVKGAVAVGDYNNDGFPDLCSGARLVTNHKGVLRAEAKPVHAGEFSRCLWVDYDHDYDLDLLLFGATQALVRNNGDGSWTDVTPSFPFVSGRAVDAAVLELREDNGFDIVVAYDGQPAVVYRDRQAGNYQAVPLGFSLTAPLQVADLDQDGFLDLVAGTNLVRNERGTLKPGTSLPGPALVFADWQNRGRLDPLPPGRASGVAAAVAADFNGDGLTDAAVARSDGTVSLLRNTTPSKNPWIRVGLAGVKNLKLAYGSRVEVKAGALYQKKVYHGVPLAFGLPGYTQADTVRITWPNGLIQNEIRQAVGRSYHYKEAQRLSGSCPMIFTWNGRRFEFVSDVLGVAPLGAGLPVDHDEYVQVPPGALRPRDGHYEVRVTEELREVSYLDQIQLVAVDHPAAVEIFTSDKFQGPPFPEFRLYGVSRRIYPTRAVDHHGRDVLDPLLRRDRTYPDGFRRDAQGRAEMHSLTLDLPAGGVLYLHGWVDWADSSVLVAASQGAPLRGPLLEVEQDGRWVTALDDMGMPAGKPKTIAVELPRGARRVRISTNMCVYWDEIFVAPDRLPPEARLTRVAPASAGLRFRGFSAVTVHPERRQPEAFHYDLVRPAAMWNPTPGYYTRYGDVRTLLETVDDRLVVMGSGDELALRFDAAALPPLPPGWKRDFLLYFNGWAKDADANTALGSSVEPLPFHAMRNYPDPEREHPDPAYRSEYNTRPALRLIHPLAAKTR